MREESFDCDKVGAEGNTSRTPKWIEKQNRRLHCHASHRRQSQNHHHRHNTHSSHKQRVRIFPSLTKRTQKLSS